MGKDVQQRPTALCGQTARFIPTDSLGKRGKYIRRLVGQQQMRLEIGALESHVTRPESHRKQAAFDQKYLNSWPPPQHAVSGLLIALPIEGGSIADALLAFECFMQCRAHHMADAAASDC
jgi:hypothetical protein